MSDIVIAVAAVRKKIEDAKVKEVELNRRLGYAEDYERGSLSVSMRWDVAERLCDETDRLRARVAELEEDLRAAAAVAMLQARKNVMLREIIESGRKLRGKLLEEALAKLDGGGGEC